MHLDVLDGAALPRLNNLNGEYVSLRALSSKRDCSQLFNASHGSEAKEAIFEFLPYTPFKDEKHFLKSLQKEEKAGETYTVLDHNEQQVGKISFLRIRNEHASIELGNIWYSLNVQQTKVNTEAIYLLLTELFENLNYRRVEWKCNALNERSRRAASRLGFSFEGVFKKDMIVEGVGRDTAWYAMCDHNWPQIKKNMRRWLYEGGAEVGISLRSLNSHMCAKQVVDKFQA